MIPIILLILHIWKQRSWKESESESHSAVSDSWQPLGLVHGILQARILEWVAFPFSRESSQPRIKPSSPTLQADSLQAEPQESPRILEWVAYPFSRESSGPRNRIGVSCIAGGFFTGWAIREVMMAARWQVFFSSWDPPVLTRSLWGGGCNHWWPWHPMFIDMAGTFHLSAVDEPYFTLWNGFVLMILNLKWVSI